MATVEATRDQAAEPLRFHGRWLVAFFFLTLAVHELHELAHTWTGRALCGGWGERDFNVWTLAPGCSTPLPTLMGPLLSYLLMYAGVVLVRRGGDARYGGVALIFAPNPFARVFTALMGGGDEGVLARAIAGVSHKTAGTRLAAAVVVTAICLPVLLAGWHALRGMRYRAAWYALLLLFGILTTGLLLFATLNRALHAGVLATPVIAGEAMLLVLVSLASFIGCAATLRWLGPRTSRRAVAAMA